MSEPLLLPSPVNPTINTPPGCLPVILQKYQNIAKNCNQRNEVEGFSYNSIFLIV